MVGGLHDRAQAVRPSGFDTLMMLLIVVFVAVMVTLFATGVLPN